jgi:hypothetical protein
MDDGLAYFVMDTRLGLALLLCQYQGAGIETEAVSAFSSNVVAGSGLLVH